MPRRPVVRVHDESAGEAEALDLSPVAAVVASIPDPGSSLISVLQQVQKIYGYLPEPVVEEIARLTGVAASRVYGVITFYAQFSTFPSGRHKVCVCQGTACHVRGAHGVLRAVENRLGVRPGETTPDWNFALETVACLGACSFAPVMTVDGQYYAKMTGSRVPLILDEHAGSGGEEEA